MAMTDEQLAQQVHDAYDRIELTDEAQDRMLANLLAANDTAQAEAPSEKQPRKAAPQGRVVQMRKRRTWQRWLPAAAVLVAALAIVQVGGLIFGSGSNMESVTDIKATEESVAYSAEETEGTATSETMLESAEATDEWAEDDAKSHADGMPVTFPELYPTVVLADGTQLTARSDQADASDVTLLLEDAYALSADGSQSILCSVYELADGSRAVCYEGEESYWLCD